MKYKTVEETIKENKKRDQEELYQLRNLKRNLESGIVFDVSEELMNILLTYKVDEL